MAKISIVVPVYNVKEYLPQCIESLINQTMKDIEIILVNDGSPDECPQICDKYAKVDKRIKVIHKKNQGVSAARNDGLLKATGEYVIFCDSDDWMELNACEKMYNEAVKNNSDIIIGDVYLAKKNNKTYVKFYNEEFITEDRRYIDELIQADIYRTYCPNPPKNGPAFGYGGPWNKLVKREIILKNRIKFDLRLKGIFDDIIYTAYILANAKRVSYIQTAVYNYRIIEGSITHSYKPNVIEINSAIFKCWEEFMDIYNENGKYNKAFYACVIRRLDESLSLYILNEKNDATKEERNILLKNLIKTEPYRTSIKEVNLLKLSKRHKILTLTSRFAFVNVMCTLYLISMKKNKYKN